MAPPNPPALDSTSKARGLLSIHLSVFLLAGTALFSKLVHLSARELIALRCLLAIPALALFVLATRQHIRLDGRREYGMVFLVGLLLAAHWVSYFHAMQISTVAIGLVALYTYPVITVFLEPLFIGSRPRGADVIAGVLVVAGVALMVPRFDLHDSTAQGVAWGVFSAIAYALRNIVQRRAFSHRPASLSMLYQVVVVAAVTLPLIDVQPIAALDRGQWGLIALFGLFFTTVPHVLFLYGLRHYLAKTAGLIACLQVAYASTLATVVLGEVPSVRTIAGGVVIVLAAAYESLRA